MPCYEKSPFIAEWESVSNEGQWVLKELRPDDLLEDIASGLTPEDLASKHKAPIGAVNHAIYHIPHMMSWRREMQKNSSSLPTIKKTQEEKTAEDYAISPPPRPTQVNHTSKGPEK
jgi:hypothetical protein